MKKHLIWLVLLIALVACKRDKEQPNPDPDLPPATQIGANTFGCYINGQPWTPKGRVGQGTNFYVNYDSGYMGGYLYIRTYKIENAQGEYLTFGGIPIASTGKYSVEKGNGRFVSFEDKEGTYYDPANDNVSILGELNITKFDLQAGIISGTFHFKIEKQGHPTIEVTAGRFDKKL